MKKREITLPTIVGLLITIGGLISGIWLVGNQLRQSASASVEEEPKMVKVSNVDDQSFTVSWVTDKALPGFIQYSAGGINQVVSDQRDQQNGEIGSYFTHYVEVNGLAPETTYEYKIGSGKNIYGAGDLAYKITTGPSLVNPPAADVSFGSVFNSSREPAGGSLVYLDMPGIVTQSALVKSSGAWVIPLSTARSVGLGSYARYDKETAIIVLNVQAGPMGSTTVKTVAKNGSPVPEITLGTNYDFTVEKLVQQPAGELTILTPNNGEMVNTNQPVIIGQGPAGTAVTVEIHSNENIIEVVTIDENGRFSYNVPQGLSPGEHTVTVSGLINGVMKSISRTFTVYAVGESSIPFYSATPSATTAPRVTASPSPTIKVVSPTVRISITPIPSPTRTPTPTRVPTVTKTPITPSPTPPADLIKSGDESMTVLWLVAGFGLMVGGGWWYRKTG